MPHLLALAVAAARDIERLVSDPESLSVRAERLDVEQVVRSVAPDGVRVDVAVGLVVEADPVRVRQVLTNLVANAQRHGETVEITASEAAGTVRIAVSDDGPGVDPDLDVFASGVSGAGLDRLRARGRPRHRPGARRRDRARVASRPGARRSGSSCRPPARPTGRSGRDRRLT